MALNGAAVLRPQQLRQATLLPHRPPWGVCHPYVDQARPGPLYQYLLATRVFHADSTPKSQQMTP